MESLITIASFPMDYQAHSARAFLQEHGVECFLADEHLQDANWLHSPMSGAGVRLSVRPALEEDARALLAQFQQHQRDGADVDWESVDPAWADESSFDDSLACPTCQSTNTNKEEPTVAWQIFSVLLLNIPQILSRDVPVWRQCGHRWKA